MPERSPAGQCFISHARADSHEARCVVAALRRRGISPWIDRSHLRFGSTEDLIRAAIENRQTISSGVAWISENIIDRPMIQKVELPALFRRADAIDDPFFLVPVVRPPLTYEAAAAAAGRETNSRNFIRPQGDAEEVAVEVARSVLHERLQRLRDHLAPDAPLEVALRVRSAGAANPLADLQLDWSEDFTEARGRAATPDSWAGVLVPALEDVARAAVEHAPGKTIVFDGAACSVPAATAVGSAFPEQHRIDIRWRPDERDQDREPWRLSMNDGTEPLTVSSRSAHVDGSDVAVLVSVTNDARNAFETVRGGLPPLRAIVEIDGRNGIPAWFPSGRQAASAARQIATGMRQARVTYAPTGAFHLFMAVPLGLAMMVGQQLATFGPTHVHEYVANDAAGSYVDGLCLLPT